MGFWWLGRGGSDEGEGEIRGHDGRKEAGTGLNGGCGATVRFV